jgi:prophage regulatory protein
MERSAKRRTGAAVTTASTHESDPPDRLVRIEEVLRQTALSRTQLYMRMAKGDFPKSVKLGHRMVAWSLLAVQAWVTAKIQQAAATRRAA